MDGMHFYKYNGYVSEPIKNKKILETTKCEKLDCSLSEVNYCPIFNFDDTGDTCVLNLCEFAVKIHESKSSDSDK